MSTPTSWRTPASARSPTRRRPPLEATDGDERGADVPESVDRDPSTGSASADPWEQLSRGEDPTV